jgi:hypothetical protein
LWFHNVWIDLSWCTNAAVQFETTLGSAITEIYNSKPTNRQFERTEHDVIEVLRENTARRLPNCMRIEVKRISIRSDDTIQTILHDFIHRKTAITEWTV